MQIKSLFKLKRAALLLLLSTLNPQLSTLHAQGTAFTYQGRLNNGSEPANGSYDLTFTLFNVGSGGSALAGPLTNSATSVSNGLFIATIDLGNQFSGADRWLEISVRTNGGGAFTTLSPRQQLKPTPYAVTAGNVVSGGLAAGSYGNAVTLNNTANQFTGGFTGNGANVTNVNAATLNGLTSSNFWQLGGNAGTTPGTHFLGTTDNKALTVKVNNTTALQIVPGTTLPNLVGGLAGTHPSVLASGVSGAVIAGGNAPSGAVSGNGAGDYQAVYDNDGTVGGGFGNKAGSNDGDPTDAAFATVAGGVFNSATNYAATVAGGDGNLAGGSRSVVGGGYGNMAAASFSFIGGGQVNTVRNATNSVIAGGYANFIGPIAVSAVIGGGAQNTNLGAYAVVCGGWSNNASGNLSFIGGGGNDGSGDLGNIASGWASSVVGGQQNTASNSWATVGGGGNNTAGGVGATAAGGLNNVVNNSYATISGGVGNQASGGMAFVGGGGVDSTDGYPGNTASGDFSVIAGGSGNSAGSLGASIGGGFTNAATGIGATVPGGFNNMAAGTFSLAAGDQAQALQQGTFVWADATGGAFSSTAPNQFLMRATGGMGINTPNPQGTVHVYSTNNPTVVRIQSTGTPGLGRVEFVSNPQGDVNEWRPAYIQSLDAGGFTGGLGFYVNGTGSGSKFGSTEVMRIVNGHVGIGTTAPTHLLQVGNNISPAYCDGLTWQSGSDRNAKEGFVAINPREVLEKVSALPITEWKYKAEAGGAEHLGPMAQDFHAAFGLNGTDDTHIATVDEGGVALAAIQGLNEKVEGRNQKAEASIQKLEAENAELKQRLETLEKIILDQKSN